MYTNLEYFNWNLKDSAADSKLKLLKAGEIFGVEKPGGEKRIHIGSSANKARYDSFFFPTRGKTVLFEFSKADLILYMIDAKEEYIHPKQNYRLDISKYYDDLLKEQLKIEDETLFVRFETNIDKRYYLARPKGDAYYANYSFISKICLPYVTEIVFIRAIDDDGNYHFFLKPRFLKVTTPADIPSEDDLDDSCDKTPIQTIYFGAPGTGKSHCIDEDPIIKALPKENKVRTMFHPESDYSSFVGCYKPVMEKPEPIGHINNPIGKPREDCDLINPEASETEETTGEKYLPLYLFSHNDCLNLDDDVKSRREEISYKFTPQAFTIAYVKAWEEYFSATSRPVYLIIEEINRGNCAQIFGNLFQLLDRDGENFSKYAIDADFDLRKYLAAELKDNTGALLSSLYSANTDFMSWTTNNDKKSIVEGTILCLPPNLHIVASMNTSDQGLFPMDSAFKRRWQWKYIPIKNEQKWHKIIVDQVAGVSTGLVEATPSLSLEYDWWTFLEKVNNKIEDASSSSDKKLGYWFIKPLVKGDRSLDIESFTCKVISYLWNDVFKNVPEGECNIFSFDYHGNEGDPRKKKEIHPFDTFFDPVSGVIDTQMVKDFLEKLEVTTCVNTEGTPEYTAHQAVLAAAAATPHPTDDGAIDLNDSEIPSDENSDE